MEYYNYLVCLYINRGWRLHNLGLVSLNNVYFSELGTCPLQGYWNCTCSVAGWIIRWTFGQMLSRNAKHLGLESLVQSPRLLWLANFKKYAGYLKVVGTTLCTLFWTGKKCARKCVLSVTLFISVYCVWDSSFMVFMAPFMAPWEHHGCEVKLATWVGAAIFRPWGCRSWLGSLPIGSMYAIDGNIYHQYTPNVSIYAGSYGLDLFRPKLLGLSKLGACFTIENFKFPFRFLFTPARVQRQVSQLLNNGEESRKCNTERSRTAESFSHYP